MKRPPRSAGSLLVAFVTAIIVACAPANEPPPERQQAAPPERTSSAEPERTTDLSPEAANTLADIRALIETGSLRQLGRYADRYPGFTSNFGSDSHFDYWYLLRRTGVEPLDQLSDIFDQPHGDILVGDKRWHIWPDFAALPENARNPARMSLEDRTRLLSLIGEQAAFEMRGGAPYPGVRTAISEDGRWIYWLFETGDQD